jgi:short-chain Z-isoprenyl diphosphate synthase
VGIRDLAYSLYERRLLASLDPQQVPHHVGVILDGNRRWARALGAAESSGHRAGAERIAALLEWCDEAGVELVTLWLLSTDNLARPGPELDPLLEIIERVVTDLAECRRWRINPVGSLDLLPQHTAEVLKQAATETREVQGLLVNVAVGYGGRQEIADAVRSLLAEQAASGASMEELSRTLSADDISSHLYTKGQPDPDLVIRTSGEQRLSGFMLWQSAHSEYYFCEAYWPDFRRVDFLRALRSYAQRHRRYGG